MACLLDTGILLRAFDASSSEYRVIRQDLRSLVARQERMVVALQNLAEFWNVSTRPIDNNGYGLSVERTNRRLQTIERICEVVTEGSDSYRIWKELLNVHRVVRVAVHDARLVSVMQAHGISDVFTLNERDFRRYSGITTLSPLAATTLLTSVSGRPMRFLKSDPASSSALTLFDRLLERHPWLLYLL